MVKKRNHDSSEFQTTWASYKIEYLQAVVKEIRSLSQSPSLPEWQKNWFTIPSGIKEGDDYTYFNSWSDFFKGRNEDIETFLKSGILGYSLIYFYEDILDDEGINNVIERDCLDLIRIIEIFSYEKHGKGIFETIEDYLHTLTSTLALQYGRNLLKWEQKQARSGSGIGQKRACEKRIATLVESLRPYAEKDSNEILIHWRTLDKLIDQTFIGAEDYPRHTYTKKTYREYAEIILGKKIVQQGRRSR